MFSFENFLEELKNNQNTFFVDSGTKLIKFTAEEVTKEEHLEQNDLEIDTETTIVTALWDLGRDDLGDGFKRSYDHYKNKFAEILASPASMYIYVSKTDEEFIWKHRSKKNTVVKIMELDQFDTWFEFTDKVQEIRNNPEWYDQARWLADSPQAKLKYYNPVVMSKMFLLNDAAIANPFGSKHLYWLDAGIANTVHPGYFTHDKVYLNLPKLSNHLNKFLFISYAYDGGTEIHGFERNALAKFCEVDFVSYVCRGGFFGGKVELIHEINSIYYSLLRDTIHSGLMGTEESIFTIISHKFPELTHAYAVERNGLIWPFFNKLKNVDELIKEIPEHQVTVTNLYILGFNSPDQFKTLCESIKNADPHLFAYTKKILVNNSTDESTFQQYDDLCKLYNFEEIHKDNIGVCGGRQFVAEHFDESNANFYLYFEDDMNMNGPEVQWLFCRNGFRRYIPNLYKTIIKIMSKEKFDFLKLSFSEFYGENGTQWAWYNVPQTVRTEHWPDYNMLPETGLDPNAPRTKFNNIKVIDNTPYVDGEIYYSNWPQIVSKTGNKKMFIDTKWANPFEQTWMSHIFQETVKGNIKPGLLLASVIDHHRFYNYEGSIRREN